MLHQTATGLGVRSTRCILLGAVAGFSVPGCFFLANADTPRRVDDDDVWKWWREWKWWWWGTCPSSLFPPLSGKSPHASAISPPTRRREKALDPAAQETAVTGVGVGETSETWRDSTGIPSISVLLSVQVQTPFPVGVTYKMAASEKASSWLTLEECFQNKGLLDKPKLCIKSSTLDYKCW